MAVSRLAKKRARRAAGRGGKVVQLPVPAGATALKAPEPSAPARLPQQLKLQARTRTLDRFRTPNRFGDLTASSLQAVLNQLDQGKVDQWSDLVDFALDDDTLASLNTTRLDRVAQADYIVEPSEWGDQVLAREVAAFLEEQLSMTRNWAAAFRDMLHAIPLGFAALEEHWDYRDGRYYVPEIQYVPGNKFRYGPQWDLRYYDRGNRAGDDGYGETLWPYQWIVHTHRESAGHPSRYGLLRKAVYRWLFLRWGDKSHVLYVEKHGHPGVRATVGPNTPDAVREDILTRLENFSYDHVMVMEEGTSVEVSETNGTGSTVHIDNLNMQRAQLAKLYLGTSDAVEPGPNGNQAAVTTRAGVTMDPRMVRDGDNACTTVRDTYFAHNLYWNLHLFGNRALDEIPIANMRLKTADDEVVRDQSDKVEELEAEAKAEGRPIEINTPEDLGAEPTAGGSPKPPPQDAAANGAERIVEAAPPDLNADGTEKAQDAALNGAQVTSLVDILTKVAAGELPRSSGVEVITAAFPIDRAKAERLMGDIGQGFTPEPDRPPEQSQPEEPQLHLFAYPKARPRKGRGALARALRGEL